LETFKSFIHSLTKINETNFEDIALRLFHYQALNNPIYRQYLGYLKRDAAKISTIDQIPFLPINFFKNQIVKTGLWNSDKKFSSSGTTGSITSSHLIYDLDFYHTHSRSIFKNFYGDLESFHFLALLPSYLEREGSSLIEMIKNFIIESKSEYSGFYLQNHRELVDQLIALKKKDRTAILWGVSFALLDLAERYELDLSHCIIMETGGMKGRRKEWIREELHAYLTQRFNVKVIHSEYGMTELMSQAYSLGFGQYQCPSSMQIIIRNINDPFEILPKGKTGGINVIDLANFHSCAFIETQDIGVVNDQGYFEVLGRIDNSDIRGCNLLVG
jgi:phenylacetate-coenzyme A ligase PaaK-like adenylate-forming protein